MDYVTATDLKAVVIGVISSVIVIAVERVARWYWMRRTLKGMQRRLKYAEAKKAQLDDLASSDRSILILGFSGLFGLTFIVAISVVGYTVLSVPEHGFSPTWLLVAAVALMTALASLSIFIVFNQLREYPGSVQRFEKTISEIRRKLTGKDRPGDS
jgi:uncharacterized membrane protein YbhN (UPF0104 family)